VNQADLSEPSFTNYLRSLGEERSTALLQTYFKDSVATFGFGNQPGAFFHSVAHRLLQVHILAGTHRLQGGNTYSVEA